MASVLRRAFSAIWKTAFCLTFPIVAVLALPLVLAGVAYNFLARLWLRVSGQNLRIRVMHGSDALYFMPALSHAPPTGGVVLIFRGDLDIDRARFLGKHLFACAQVGPRKGKIVDFLVRYLDKVTLRVVRQMVCYATVKYGLFMWKHDQLFDFNNHFHSVDKLVEGYCNLWIGWSGIF
jgi:hypothetical protein